MPKLGMDVGFQGESGSRSDIAKLSRMTLKRRSAVTAFVEETEELTDHSIAFQESLDVMRPGNCYESRSGFFGKFHAASTAGILVPNEKEQWDRRGCNLLGNVRPIVRYRGGKRRLII
jgi:hypothetical protein